MSVLNTFLERIPKKITKVPPPFLSALGVYKKAQLDKPVGADREITKKA